MKINSAEFLISATAPSQYPLNGLPQIALVGRSNVGKSSLINAITGKKNLAKTGSTPGKTRTINFYRLNNKFYLVDLPGYGFASVSKAERKDWKTLIENYFNLSVNLKGVIIVLDVRRAPDTGNAQIYEWIDAIKLPRITVLTKTDKLSANELKAQKRCIEEAIPYIDTPVLFSAIEGRGIKDVWARIREIINKT